MLCLSKVVFHCQSHIKYCTWPCYIFNSQESFTDYDALSSFWCHCSLHYRREMTFHTVLWSRNKGSDVRLTFKAKWRIFFKNNIICLSWICSLSIYLQRVFVCWSESVQSGSTTSERQVKITLSNRREDVKRHKPKQPWILACIVLVFIKYCLNPFFCLFPCSLFFLFFLLDIFILVCRKTVLFASPRFCRSYQFSYRNQLGLYYYC